MPESDRLASSTEWIDLEFVERERTPREISQKGIRHHLAELSLSNTVLLLGESGVKRSRTAIHNWVQKAELQPAGGESPDRVAFDQKAIRVNDEQYWLYAAVDPETNRIHHTRLFPTDTIPIGREFLTELAEKHDVTDVPRNRRCLVFERDATHLGTAVFLIDDADDPKGALRRENLSYRVEIHGDRNSVERIFHEVQRRTLSISNCFSHVDPPTAETWLQAHAVWWNHA